MHMRLYMYGKSKYIHACIHKKTQPKDPTACYHADIVFGTYYCVVVLVILPAICNQFATCVCVCVCMYAGMCACMHICRYVCMYVSIGIYIYICPPSATDDRKEHIEVAKLKEV